MLLVKAVKEREKICVIVLSCGEGLNGKTKGRCWNISVFLGIYKMLFMMIIIVMKGEKIYDVWCGEVLNWKTKWRCRNISYN